MEKEDPRLLAGHVRVDRDDLDPALAQRLEYALQLRFEHREVAVDHRAVAGTRERSPGIHAHLVADRHAVLAGRTSEDDLVDAVREVALLAEDGVEPGGVERA